MRDAIQLIQPDWPAPANIRACVSTRAGGVSGGGYASLNLASHVGDHRASVAENRRRFAAAAQLPAAVCWLTQVHGTAVVELGREALDAPVADACWSQRAGQPCAVLTADCLPVLFASRDGQVVAAAHAGWRGLLAGVLEQTLAALPVPASQMLAWLGPAIGPTAFEVGAEVRAGFLAQDAAHAAAFVPSTRSGHYTANLFALARSRLESAGVQGIFGGEICTVSDATRFFSHRRDTPCAGHSGRFATAIWRAQ